MQIVRAICQRSGTPETSWMAVSLWEPRVQGDVTTG
jgi:hypothetical protein